MSKSITTSVVPFSFENQSVRAINREGECWLVAADICSVLGIKNPRSSVALLDEDEKGVHTVDTLKGKQEVAIINESGLYALILRSRKQEAKRFRKWVTSEVLPAIRITGHYFQQPDLATAAQALRHKRFYLSFEYDGKISLHQMPDNPYDGLAKAIADPTNIGLEDKTIEAIGQACMTALAHRAKCRKEHIAKLRMASR